MHLKRIITSLLLLAGIFVFAAVFTGSLNSVFAAPAYQLTPFPTPTPGADGRILYQVQDQDTLWRISAVTGVSLDELRQLNSLSADSVIRPGQVLLLGVVSPQQITPAPGTTLDPALQPTPTATALADASEICALLYLDENGDAMRQEAEIALADGEVSVTERQGAYSNKGTTAYSNDTTPLCFEVPPGEYIVTMALPGGFNRTTSLNVSVELFPGDTSWLNFGAQPTEAFEPLTEVLEDGGGGGSNNVLIGVLGASLLLGGVGVGIWAMMNNRRRFTIRDE